MQLLSEYGCAVHGCGLSPVSSGAFMGWEPKTPALFLYLCLKVSNLKRRCWTSFSFSLLPTSSR